MDKGIPFDVAFTLDAETRFVWCVIYGNMERNPEERFDWARMEFPKPRGV